MWEWLVFFSFGLVTLVEKQKWGLASPSTLDGFHIAKYIGCVYKVDGKTARPYTRACVYQQKNAWIV